MSKMFILKIHANYTTLIQVKYILLGFPKGKQKQFFTHTKESK